MLALNTLFTQTAFSYALCYYAHQASIKYTQFSSTAYDCVWYNFTAAERRLVCMMIIYGQQDMEFSGFHMIPCSLATFAKVSSDIKMDFTLRFNSIKIGLRRIRSI